jgi:hypothetical protein
VTEAIPAPGLSKTRRLLVAALAGMVMAIITAAFTSPFVARYRDLAKGGRPARAAVTALEPRNHQQVHYTFRLDGRVYAGTGQAGYGAPRFSELAVGDSIPIYYLPRNPEKSAIGDPRPRFRNERRASRDAIVGTFLIITAIAWFGLRRRVWFLAFLWK